MSGQQPPFGTCPVCHRLYHLTAKGVLRMHAKDRRQGITCDGSGRAPAVPS